MDFETITGFTLVTNEGTFHFVNEDAQQVYIAYRTALNALQPETGEVYVDEHDAFYSFHIAHIVAVKVYRRKLK